MSPHQLRTATTADAAHLLRLWSMVYEDDGDASDVSWKGHAHAWFLGAANATGTARLPLVELEGEIVATAVGTLELGVPNPWCARGRSVRLANVITLLPHRGNGYATLLVHDVVEWARSIGADRVDLSATPAGQRVYEKVGFQPTRAPRMKLVL